MAQVIISGEAAGTWEDATRISGETYTYEVDVTGITDMETLDAYMKDVGCMPYATLPGGDSFGPGKIYLKTKYDQTNGEPVQSNGLSLGGVLEFLPILGAVDLGSFTTEGFYTKVTKNLVVNAILRAMFLQFEAQQITEQVKAGINNCLDEFADAQGKIAIYVDKLGKAFCFADMIEKVREYLVNIGAYNTTDTYPDLPAGTQFEAYLGNDLAFVTTTKYQNTQILHKLMLSDSNPREVTRIEFWRNNTLIHTINGQELSFCIPNNALHEIHILNEVPNTTYDTVLFYHNDTVLLSGSSNYTPKQYRFTYNNVYYSGYNLAYSALTSLMSGAAYSATMTANGITTLNSVTNVEIIGTVKYTLRIPAVSIDGIIKDANIPTHFPDLAYGLDEVLPDWWQKRKALAVPRAKHQVGDNDDIYAKSPALPLDIPTDLALEDSYAGDSELVTEGDIADELKDFIIDVLPTIIDEIIEYTQDPTIPDIPVDDHGDTPPEDPTLLSGASNGLWTIYNPTISQVNSFGAWLWSSSILDQITRMFNSPIDAVIGFHMIYCTPTTGASKHIMAGFLDSEVSAAEVTNQYVEINCGQVAVTEFYANLLDYLNTRISIFLPFCGFFPLDTAVVMGSTLEVTYRVDVLTGTCLAQVKVIKENSAAVMYSFSGNCSVQVPLTATTYTGMVGALVSTLSAGASLMTGNMIGAGASAMRAMTAGMNGLSGVRQSGSMGANAGALGIRTPYLIITHPVQANAADFGTIQGLPANKTVRLGDVSGFTRVYACHLDTISGATADEIEQIREMLNNGVIL